MTTDTRPSWPLAPRALLYVVLPFIVFVATNLLLFGWDQVWFHVAQPFGTDGLAEGAGRLGTLATFLLFCTLALACLFYSARAWLYLDGRARWTIGIAYALTVLVGTSTIFALDVHEGDPYLERALPCVSFGKLGAVPSAAPPSGAPADAPAAKAPPPPRLEVKTLETRCVVGEGRSWVARVFAIPLPRFEGDPYPRLRIMFAIAGFLLFFTLPAIVWAAIACLALPDAPAAERIRAWTLQTLRLNRLLYMTAAFLVAGLLFSRARLLWPGFSLHPADLQPFADHVGGMILYLGVANSVVIASFYLPVAAALAAAQPDAPSRPGGKAAKEGEKGADPFGAFRTTLTILTPALVGLIGELIRFSG